LEEKIKLGAKETVFVDMNSNVTGIRYEMLERGV